MSTVPTAPTPAGQPVTTQVMAPPRVAIVIYTMHGHIATMAESVRKGIQSAGGSATICQISETLPKELIERLGPSNKPNYPLVAPGDLTKFDAFIFGIPIRFGNFWELPRAVKELLGCFGLALGHRGSFRQSTVMATLSTFTHHGMIFVPLGYARTFPQLTNLSEIHGGSPLGAGTFAAPDGSRQPTALELNIAESQGRLFWEAVSKVKF